MPSVIEICNLSLSAIGQGVINALNEASPQAEACSLHYASARDSLLREFPWNFTTQTLVLAETVQTVPGWQYVYQHPANTLWVRKVFDAAFPYPEIPNEYEIASIGVTKYICCDIYQAYAKITTKAEDTALFDPLFIEAFVYKLALKLTMPLTTSTNKTQEIMTHYQQALMNAKLAGAVEGAPKKPETQKPKSNRTYITARW